MINFEIIRYECKDNDNKIKLGISNGKIDEIWTQADGDKGWTAFSYSDMMNAIKKANEFIKITSKIS